MINFETKLMTLFKGTDQKNYYNNIFLPVIISAKYFLLFAFYKVKLQI